MNAFINCIVSPGDIFGIAKLKTVDEKEFVVAQEQKVVLLLMFSY